MKSIKDMVKGDKKVRFVQYKHNQLWYETECGFRFSVDTSDTGDDTFLAEDKAIIYMRYIRKALEARKAENEDQKVQETGKEELEKLVDKLSENCGPDLGLFRNECPRAYGGCHCSCHRVPGVKHCMPCCYPSDDDKESVGFRCT